MEQSVYTRISKSIGFQGDPIDLPSLEEANELYKAVVIDKSSEAFTKVFRFYRFGKQAETFAEAEVSEMINDTFNRGSKHFR